MPRRGRKTVATGEAPWRRSGRHRRGTRGMMVKTPNSPGRGDGRNAFLPPLPGLLGRRLGYHGLRLVRLSSDRAPPVATACCPSGAKRWLTYVRQRGNGSGWGNGCRTRCSLCNTMILQLPDSLGAHLDGDLPACLPRALRSWVLLPVGVKLGLQLANPIEQFLPFRLPLLAVAQQAE